MKDEFIIWLETKRTPLKQKSKRVKSKAKHNHVIEMLRELSPYDVGAAMTKGDYDPSISDFADAWLNNSKFKNAPRTYNELKYHICHMLVDRGIETMENGYPTWQSHLSMEYHMIGDLHHELIILSTCISELESLEHAFREWLHEAYPDFANECGQDLYEAEGDYWLKQLSRYKKIETAELKQ